MTPTERRQKKNAFLAAARRRSLECMGEVDNRFMIQWLAYTCADLSDAVSLGTIRAEPGEPPAIPRKPHHRAVDEIEVENETSDS